MDPTYANALATRDALRKQRAAIEAELDKVESWIEMYPKFAAQPAKPEAKSSPRKIARREDVVKHVSELLADGKPRSTRSLLNALELVYGLQMYGKDDTMKIVNLSQILGRERDRNGTFKVDRATGWSLVRPQEGKSPVNGGTATGLFS